MCVRPTLVLAAIALVFSAPGRAAEVSIDCDIDVEIPELITGQTALQLPDDGLVCVDTITIASGATLTFLPNSANTPVRLYAHGPIEINGEINLNGQGGTPTSGGAGGPGGYDGGNPRVGLTVAGHGHGPGGGGIGNAAGSDVNAAHAEDTLSASAYGNTWLLPLTGGSGGGSQSSAVSLGGGGGGGAILIASATSITFVGGTITARGGLGSGNNTTYRAGAGGAIRLVAPEVGGNGTLDVREHYVYGSAGRLRIDTDNLAGIGSITAQPATALSVGSLFVLEPEGGPRLSVTEVAGQSVDPALGEVTVVLPPGSSQLQAVSVLATGFAGNFTVQVVAIPDHGARVSETIDFVGDGEESADLVFPINERTRVYAWVVDSP